MRGDSHVRFLEGRRRSNALLLPDIDVDATSGLVHTLIGTSGNVSNVTQAHALLHGDEIAALGDAGYQGVEKREENRGKSVTWHVAMKRAKRKALPKNKLGRMLEKLEQLKASVRAKVEHPCHQDHVIKNLFRHRKTRYRGLAKNTAQLFTLFGFANLLLAGRRFALPNTRVAS
jgi:IS5 family transposase